jgi:prolyl oligopeptidase
MMALVGQAILALWRVDRLLRVSGMEGIKCLLARFPVSQKQSKHGIDQICYAVDLACVFYVRQVKCLQRSVTTTTMLRERGYSADLVIGACPVPFRSHAWVEVGTTVVNDKPYIKEIYMELTRAEALGRGV